ncbi:MAG TPA: POTRA domain-containing protein [Rhodothermales bacterium]
MGKAPLESLLPDPGVKVINQLRRSLWILALLPGLLAARAPVDSTGAAPTWSVSRDGRTTLVDASDRASAADSALTSLRSVGYYFARIDSVRLDSVGGGTLFVTAGPRYQVGSVEIEGANVLDADALLRDMSTRSGEVLDPAILEEDLVRILGRYEEAGYPLASVEIASVDLVSDAENLLRLRLTVDEGPVPVLAGVEVEGEARTKPAFLARVAGLRAGQRLRAYRTEDVRARLEATGFYRSVGTPQIRMISDSAAVVVFPLDEHPPGAFDLVLGFLPPTGRDEALGIVGNGHLELNNLFGAGRALALRLDRLPGKTSSVDVRASDPFILGLPLRAEVQFSGLQQDSAYTRTRYGAELGVRIALGMQGFVTVGRELTRPGVASRGAIARADAWFAGGGIRTRRVDSPISPTRGYAFEIAVESGRKTRNRSVAGDPAAPAEESIDQERMRGFGRLYVPIHRRQVLVVGADASAILSGVRDPSDLLRFGGATTLRGYDEDRFLARTVARGLVEYRYLLDRQSFAFLFLDVGYVDTPVLANVEALRGIRPGYGIGLQFETAVGLVSASYAISSEAGPTNGRVHVGLSFGL